MRRLLLLLVLLLCGAVSAFAGPSQYEFVDWNNGIWQNGYPYEIAPDPNPTSQIYAVMCDDWAHGGYPGQVWSANVTNLGTQNISLARFNNIATPWALGPLQLYDEAGWILQQTLNEPISEWKYMNYAVWHIFDSQAPLLGDAGMWIAEAQQQAQMHFPGDNFADVWIITPVNQHDQNPNGPQEFLYLGNTAPNGGQPTQTTPEPGTWLLMGTGALTLLGRKLWS